MKYEEFAERAKSAFDDCGEMKRMLWNTQTVIAAVPDMVRKNERLEKEKAELKAEIERLKSEAPDDCMMLPLDADIEPIRIGDTVWYVGSDVVIPKDHPLKVVGFTRMDGVPGTLIETREYPAAVIKPKWLTHNQPEPPDSWEKLEEDALKTSCAYFGKLEEPNAFCTECPHGAEITGRGCIKNMRLDLVRRAKRLAGIEEQEGE